MFATSSCWLESRFKYLLNFVMLMLPSHFAVYGNLKLMKKTLNEKQYADYARVLNVTLQNKGIEVK